MNCLTLKPSKSAVVFAVVFWGLVACEPLNSDSPAKTQPPAPTEPEIRSATVLTRGSEQALTVPRNVASGGALNPTQTALLRDLFEGLVRADPQGNIQGGVAESWQTADNRRWEFMLRENAKWSNGEPVRAQDFVASWQSLAQSNSPLKTALSFLNLTHAQEVLSGKLPPQALGISAKNDRTLLIELDKATPYLPEMLLNIAFLPQYGAQSEGEGLISNGAYQLAHEENGGVILRKNPYYWDQAAVHFEQVNYQPINAAMPLNAMDVVIQPTQTAPYTHYFPKLCSYYYEFNFRDPKLKEMAVRKALAALVSPSYIVQNEGIAARADSHFLPQNLQQENEDSWQPTMVEQLLQQQGISETQPLQLKISYDNQGIHGNIANRLIRMWSQSDMIRVQPDPLSWQQLQEKRNKGDFQVIRSGWCADYNEPSAFLNLLYSQSPDNKAAYHNETADKLLAQTLEPKLSADKRRSLYQQLERLVQNEYVFLPLFQYMTPMYLDPSIGGYDLKNPTEIFYSKDLWRKADQRKE